MRSRRCLRAARPSLRVGRSRHPATVCPDGWSPPRYLVTRNRIRLTGQLARLLASGCDSLSWLLGDDRIISSRPSRRASPRYSLPMIAGEKAPDFTLYDHTGRPRTLSALLPTGRSCCSSSRCVLTDLHSPGLSFSGPERRIRQGGCPAGGHQHRHRRQAGPLRPTALV